ncbi:MAG: oxygenase MpaB family protein [Myxococcota bacterium]
MTASPVAAPPERHAPLARVHRASEARARFGPVADRLFAALERGDPLADRAVDALAGRREAGAWIRRGAAGEALAEAPEPVRTFFADCRHVPAFVDEARARRGARVFFRAGMAGGITLGAKSLVGGYCAPAGNKPLAFSGALERRMSRRLAETGRFVVATHGEDALRPGREGWAITLRVRLMHAQVRRLLRTDPRWDPAWGVPINQHDMLATTLLFSSVFLEGCRAFGVPIDEDEADAFLHLWCWSGWLMGVEEELLPASDREGRRLCRFIALTQGPPDDDSRALTRGLLAAPVPPGAPAFERWLARSQGALGEGFCRTLLGDELADGLGLARSPAQHVPALVRMALGGARGLVPKTARARLGLRAERLGEAYWARNLRLGLAGLPAAFRLPDRLEGTPGRARTA